MTLISLIVVLFAERVATQSQYWQADFYLTKFHRFIHKRSLLDANTSDLVYLAIILIPALLLFVLLQAIDSNFLRLIIDSAILMVCIGCPSLRATYKCYLQAANRGDFQACSMYADQLGHSGDSPSSFGQMLVWLNYQHYAAVIIWFAALGPAGSLLYVLARSTQQWLSEQQDMQLPIADKLMAVLDWLPVRITALGFLLVGHFSRALPIWLHHFAGLQTPAKTVLCEVAKAAEDVEPDENDCTEEPCTLVRLAKRNVLFLVVFISVLSLSGWIR
ncbi:beta-lactamase regulator AmpE [Aliiglaciecola sp. LCG003]|uniref:beta-lactamase regulator AmpE n=1 Tax=Aliiglaciecola sp. LCG003 TaxID=3053655 RepID=UPI002572706F|nr:beta-lactamase regulator AmpE [Aliiglaciecola sp. LCG003]WJG10205.1 beta-lactamase regulator AmpE [Aliiglaciecola sp. LCG003]